MPVDRSGRGYLVGSAILVVLNGIASLRQRSTDTTTAYFVGQVVGSLVMSALVAVIIYAIARAATKGKPRSTSAKIVFWVLLVWFIVLLGSIVGRAANPGAASAQTGFADEDRRGLTVGADSIRHARLGFAIPYPGKTFIAAAEMERALAAQFGGQIPPDLLQGRFAILRAPRP